MRVHQLSIKKTIVSHRHPVFLMLRWGRVSG